MGAGGEEARSVREMDARREPAERDFEIARRGELDARERRQDRCERAGADGCEALRERLAREPHVDLVAEARAEVGVARLEREGQAVEELVVWNASRGERPRDEERVIDGPEARAAHAGRPVVAAEEREVDLTVFERAPERLRGKRHHAEADVGLALHDRGQAGQHDPLEERLAGAEREEGRRGGRALSQRLDPCERPARVLGDLTSERGERETSAATLAERATEVGLELSELATELALERGISSGSTRDPARVVDAHEGLQPVEREALLRHDWMVMDNAIPCMVSHLARAHRQGMKLPIFFDARMVSSPDSYSPSARKPAEVVARLDACGIPVERHRPTPVTVDELSRVHDRAFVEGVLEGRIANGFGDRSTQVAASLPWTSGAMLSAARHAIAHRTMVLAPCSGFHHAGVRRASGFCTFNGLAVAAAALHHAGARTIGILDADYHYGDGTVEILGGRDWVRHVTVGERYTSPEHARPFFEALPEMMESMRGCDVLLYQAGADPHVDDPLGGFLTTEQLALRDAIVFRAARAMGLPVAWNLAGGYRRDANGGISEVLRVHENTARACLESVRAIESGV